VKYADLMIIDMIIGMILGMAASPILMRIIKVVRQRRRVSKLLHEISELQKNGQQYTNNFY
jgi:hypothetical protein